MLIDRYPEILRSTRVISDFLVFILQSGDVHSLILMLDGIARLFAFVTEYLYSVLGVYVTRTTPYSRCGHQVTDEQSAISLKKKEKHQYTLHGLHCYTNIDGQQGYRRRRSD